MSFIISNIVNESFVGCWNVNKQSGYVTMDNSREWFAFQSCRFYRYCQCFWVSAIIKCNRYEDRLYVYSDKMNTNATPPENIHSVQTNGNITFDLNQKIYRSYLKSISESLTNF